MKLLAGLAWLTRSIDWSDWYDPYAVRVFIRGLNRTDRPGGVTARKLLGEQGG
jgi:hypothetical protein